MARVFNHAYLAKKSIDSNASNANNLIMATLTIRNLDDATKRKIRIVAAQHGHSMEAEARNILTQALSPHALNSNASESLKQITGIWKTRGTTEQLMQTTRGIR